MRILFLNQYFPPDPAPTGVLLGEIAETLRSQGHHTDFVSAESSYRHSPARGPRIIREARALIRILWKSLRSQRPDLIISGSSPPALLVAATVAAARHRARSIHWAMDLYPEIAVALGEIPPGIIPCGVARAMAVGYRRCNRVVALDSDMQAHLREQYRIDSEIIHPWVPASVILPDPAPPPPGAPFTWIYSGNLGRAHEWQTLLETQAELERRAAGIRLVFQGGGPSWPAARDASAHLRLTQCEFRDYTPEHDLARTLLDAHCTVVSQLPAARALLWPSKLALLLALPRPILWVGPTDSTIAAELQPIPHTGVFAPGQFAQIAEWLLQLKASGQIHVTPAINAAAHRAAAFERWTRNIHEVSGSTPPVRPPG